MQQIFRFLKRLIFVLIGLSLLSLSAWSYLNSNYAKPHIAHFVGESLSKWTKSDVFIGSVSFSFPNALTLNDISIGHETETPWLTVEKLLISISPEELLKGKITIQSLELDTVHLLSLPFSIGSETNTLTSEFSSTSLPITLEQVKLNHVKISPSVMSKLNLFPEHFSEELQLDAILYSDVEQWKGEICLATSIDNTLIGNTPIEVSTHFYWKPGKQLSLSNFSLAGFNSVSEGSLVYEQNTGWLEADIKGVCKDLSCFNSLLTEAVNGEASFAAQWLGSTNPSVQVHIEAPKVIYQDISFNDVVFIVSLSDIFNNLQSSLHSSIGKIVKKDIILNNLTLATTIDSQKTNWPFVFSMDEESNIISTNTEGYWSLHNDTLHLSIAYLNGKISDIPLTLEQQVSLKLSPLGFDSTPLEFNLGGGAVKASINYQASSLSSSFECDNIPIGLLHSHIPALPLQGIISGKVQVKGTLETPQVACNLLFKEIKIDKESFDKVPPISGQLQINVNENDLQCKGNTVFFNHFPIYLETHLPITLSLYPFALNVNKMAPIFGNIKASGEIEKILQMLSNDAINLSGSIDTAISITGTMESPLINGAATISNGSFEILETGTVLSNVSANFESSGKQITLKKLSASDKYGKTLAGSGILLLDDSSQFPYQLDFDIKELAVIDQDIATGTFSGRLILKGNVAGATLSGSAIANSLTITLPEQNEALQNTVDVTYINQPDNEKGLLIEKDPPWPMLIDINVSAPDNVTISGGGLASKWKGNLNIKGPVTKPLFSGNFKIITGQYFFNGKHFDISQGLISLNGSLDDRTATTLYVIVSKDLGKVKVEVIAKGPASNPEISFRSNPPLSQREILSWILFNRGTSEISPFQGSQLTESITNLKSSGSKGPDVLTKIQNSLGIDRLEISRDENNNNAVSIQVGKYISDNIFISVNKSDVNRIAVEATLMPNIKLQAQVGDDSQGQLLLKWKHDY